MRPTFLSILATLPLAFAAVAARAADPLSSPQVPAWAAGAVWYQIFPERFRNGDPNNDPTRDSLEPPVAAGPDWRISPWTADWYARDDWERATGPDFYKHGVFERRYGGDLQGVLDKLPYLVDLGVNALYFCPVFYARSLHKYDGSSYHHIDPFFGPDPRGDFALMARETSDPATWQWTAADKIFLQVVKAAHARGMKVIIDGVFNHTGQDFFAFANLRKLQARSPYKDWYVVRSFDDPETRRVEFDYEGWWGHKSLPIFGASADKKNLPPGPKKYIFDATRRWMDPAGNGHPEDGIDGWRLDVADERPAEFWAEWNALVRRLNPQAYTSAEIWKDPAYLIRDGGFSACMNYHAFAIPTKGWLVDNHLTPSRFARQLEERRAAVPRPVAYAMQNLMDSHDTDRLASMIVNADPNRPGNPNEVEYNGNNDLREAPNYSPRRPDARERAIQRLVVLFQMTYVGAPMLYYGDEAGMWGAHDPDNRMPMVWADLNYAPQALDPREGKSRTPDTVAFDQEMFRFYKRSIALHRAQPALQRGTYETLLTDDDADTFAFARRDGANAVLVALFNRSEELRTVTLRPPPGSAAGSNWLFPSEPSVLFSTGEAPAVESNGGTLSVKLPPLSGVVLGPAAR